MLDIDLQRRLDQAGPAIRRNKTGLSLIQQLTMTIAIALFTTVIGITTYAHLTAIPAMPSDDLGKLAVIVSDVTGTVPVDIWAAMERHIGKKANSFDANDQVKAIAFLLELIENQPKPTINIW